MKRLLSFLIIILFLQCKTTIINYKPVYKKGRPVPEVYKKLKEGKPILPFNKVNAADWWWDKSSNEYILYVATPEGLYYSGNSGLNWEKREPIMNYPSDIVFPVDIVLVDSATIFIKLKERNTGKIYNYVKDPKETYNRWKRPVKCSFSFYTKYGDFPKYRLPGYVKDTIVNIIHKEIGIEKEKAKDLIKFFTRSLSDKENSFVITPYYIFTFTCSEELKWELTEKTPFPDFVDINEIYWANNGYMPEELWLWTEDGLYISLDGGASPEVYLQNVSVVKRKISSALEEINELRENKKWNEAYSGYSKLLDKYSFNHPLIDSINRLCKQTEEKLAEELLKTAQKAESKEEYKKAVNLYSGIINEYPSTESSKLAKKKKSALEKKLEQQKIEEFKEFYKRVSEEKVKSAFYKLNLNKGASERLAVNVKNLDRSTVAKIIVDLLKVPLEDYSAYREYRKMTIHQKLFTILYGAEKGAKEKMIKEWLKITDEAATKLSRTLYCSYDCSYDKSGIEKILLLP